MAPVTHEIDPNADTIITLKNASTIFASWDAEAATILAKSTASATLTTTCSGSEPHTSDEGIQFRVSSRHLMLASPWFKRALAKEGWSESCRNEVDGLFHLTTAAWDAEAFLILLNMFHLRNRQIPRTVTLEMLAKTAVLADYYECGEAIEVFTEGWITALKKGTEFAPFYSRDTVLWIWTSWVFNMSCCFKRATAVAIQQSGERMRCLDLPLPTKLLDDIDARRYQAIKSIIGQLHELVEKYRSSSYKCPQDGDWSFDCGSLLLGTLTKELDRMELLSPRPEVPFTNLKLNGLCNMLRTLKPPMRLDYMLDGNGNRIRHACNLGVPVLFIVNQANNSVFELNLEETKDVNSNLPV